MALSHYFLPLQTFAHSCFLMMTMREGRCANGQFLEKTVKLILQRFMKIFISLIITIILFIYLFAEAYFKYRSNEAWPARVASVNVCVCGMWVWLTYFECVCKLKVSTFCSYTSSVTLPVCVSVHKLW